MAREAVLLVLVAVLAAGCIALVNPLPEDAAPTGAAAMPTTTGGLYASPTPLWPDPQNAPHPAWNWPTLAYPAVGEDVPEHWAPIPMAEVPQDIRGFEHVARAPAPVTRGAGIAVFGSLAVVPGFNSDTRLVDLSDPENPEHLSTISGRHRGAAIIAYPTGRLVTVMSTNNDLRVFDITDPRAPFALPTIVPVGGSHKVGVVPGTPIVYNANSRGSGAPIEVFDLTDPENPVLVQNFRGGYGCHHVYFWIDVEADKYRSICAGMQVTQLLDIEDPLNPRVIVTLPVHHGVPGTPSTSASFLRFSHFSILNEDGTVLIVGDETGGGAAPGCDVHAQAAGLSVSGALGNLYFYDVSDESSPELLGWFNPGAHYVANRQVPGTCTAHHGRLVPDPAGERELLAMAYYSAGVVLVDFTDPAQPQLVDQWATGTTTWEAWYANGYVVTGDLARGLDVLRLR